MKKFSFTLLFAVAITLIFVPSITNAQKTTNQVMKVSNADVAVFNDGEIKTINSKEQFETKAEQFKINYSNGELDLSLKINNLEKPIDLNVSLLPGQLDFFKNNVLLGSKDTIDEQYELESFRIEENTTNDTLLRPNLHLEGETVLSLGIKNKKTNDIYYLQQSIDNANVEQMMKDSKINLNTSDYDTKSIQDLELDYLLLGKDPSKIGKDKVKSSTKVDDSDNPANITDNNADPFGIVDGRVPDSIFKSGEFDEWNHSTNWESEAPYTYSYITFRFAGTENRLSYIALFNLVRNNNFNNQDFSFNFDLAENVSVNYNVYNDEIFLFGDDNRLRANDVEIRHESGNVNGIFWSREYAGRTTGSFLSNIGKAILVWVEPGSKVVDTVDELTAPTQTETGNKYTYESTVEGQETAHGRIIDQMALFDSGSIKNNNDYLLLEVEGTDINRIRQGFTYTIEYQ